MRAAGWNDSIPNPMPGLAARVTSATSVEIRGVTVMLCARNDRTPCSRRSRRNMLDEPLPVGVQRGLVGRALDPRRPNIRHVEVAGEGEPVEPAPAVRAEHELLEVVVVDVAVGHAHRLAPVLAHDPQGLGVVVGRQQGDLAADQLRVRPGAAPPREQPPSGRSTSRHACAPRRCAPGSRPASGSTACRLRLHVGNTPCVPSQPTP